MQEVHTTHTGTTSFRPTIDLDGNISVSVRVDKRILSALNAENAFTGKISNGANIGKTSQEIAGLWNKDHADDPVQSSSPEPQ